MATKMIGVMFTVEGHGRFPLDMLRYDRCWPATQRDTSAIGLRAVRRAITLTTVCPEAAMRLGTCPTTKRWESWGWKVVEVERTAR